MDRQPVTPNVSTGAEASLQLPLLLEHQTLLQCRIPPTSFATRTPNILTVSLLGLLAYVLWNVCICTVE
jgi:hypothetical protein